MSNENPDTQDSDQSEDLRRWLTIGNAVALVLILFAVTVSTFLVFALRSDVAALEEQARKSAKAEKGLQEELASIRERLRSAGPVSGSSGALRPSNIDAADPAHDCVIRPGAKNGLADCIKSGSAAPPPAPAPGH